jgi:hypothetical protein
MRSPTLIERVKPPTALAVSVTTGVITWLVFVRLLSIPWRSPLWNLIGV